MLARVTSHLCSTSSREGNETSGLAIRRHPIKLLWQRPRDAVVVDGRSEKSSQCCKTDVDRERPRGALDLGRKGDRFLLYQTAIVLVMSGMPGEIPNYNCTSIHISHFKEMTDRLVRLALPASIIVAMSGMPGEIPNYNCISVHTLHFKEMTDRLVRLALPDRDPLGHVWDPR
jgi:hypothetical protein